MSVFTVLVGVLVCLFALIVWLLKRQQSYWQSLGIPCDSPKLIVGSLHGVTKERSFREIWEQCYCKFKGTGPFAGFYWFQKPAVMVLDIALVKQILIKEFHKFTDRGFYSNEEVDPLTGQLFLLDGHKWRSMRNKLSPTFTSGKMKFMFPTVIKVAEEFVRVFGQTVDENPIVEVKDLLARFTTDVIGTCAFGIETSSLKDPEIEFRIMGKRSLVENRHNMLGIAIISSYPELARKLGMKQTLDDVEAFYLQLVRQTVTFREQHNIRRNDFMDMLIEMKNNKLLTMEQIAAQAFVFFNAGFETSSTTMGFALYELARHEDIQQRAREEVQTVLERHDEQLSYECMREMEYLDQVINETLRLYTVLPVLNRLALEDYPVPGHPNYVIKKGMPVLIPASAIHRDPDYYPEPEVFNPDNFAPDAVKQRDSVEFLPFGDGPRNCIGLRFGMMQSRIGLAVLLKNFRFSFCEQTQVPLKYDRRSFLISTEAGIFIKAERL